MIEIRKKVLISENKSQVIRSSALNHSIGMFCDARVYDTYDVKIHSMLFEVKGLCKRKI